MYVKSTNGKWLKRLFQPYLILKIDNLVTYSVLESKVVISVIIHTVPATFSWIK